MNIKEYYKAQLVKSLFLMERQESQFDDDGLDPSRSSSEDVLLRDAEDAIAKQIKQRRSISDASGVDAGGEGMVKGSPLDAEGQSPLQYAKNLQKFDTSMRGKFKDPLNIGNMGYAASRVDSLNRGDQIDKARSSQEHEKNDFDRLKEIQDRLRSKSSSESIA
jgi:hypothetical protein